jgi:diacylglycerol O-acyltransferase / wax synthase
MMTHAMSHPENVSSMSPPFVSFADQGIYLAHISLGQHAVIQVLWRYLRPVDLDALTRFRDNLAHGRLARLIRPAALPFGRHQWVSAPPPSAALAIAEAPLAPEAMQAWADAQVELPLDPARGPGWTLTIQNFTDGSTVVSLVVSHCIADGLTTAMAVSEAVRGERRPPVYPPWSVWSAHRAATTLGAELQRIVRDAPATLRALAQLARTAYTSRATYNTPAASPAVTTADDRTVVFPSAFIHVPTSVWDARAQSLGANRLTLLTAVTAAFAVALGRVRDDDVTLLIPVNQREGLSRTGGNGVALATLKVRVDELRGRLHTLQRRLRATLLRTRQEPNRLAALLPLVPFVPRRAFSGASHLALDALADLPVTCSNLGYLPKDVLQIDGGAADRICARGIDRPVARRAIEAREGVATLFAGVIPGFLALSFVAYQPGVVTEPQHLRALVERLLADYELAGEFFDA